jgi:hypothetical protein
MGGFFDGEGHISVSKDNRPSGQTYILEIGVTQRLEEPLLLFTHLGGNVHFDTYTSATGIYRWRLAARKASAALEILLPHLRVKHAQAELAIEFQNRRTRIAAERDRDWDEWAYQELKAMKRA